MEKKYLKALKLLSLFMGCLVLCFFQFRYHIVSIESALYEDVLCFMHERSFVKNDWDFFWHILSIDRVRRTCDNSYFLYRPAFAAVNAILDISFRGNFFIPGVLSILFHAVTSTGLFLMVYRLTLSFWVAGLSTLTFIFHIGCFSMIQWRYISPYVLGLGCFLIALFLCASHFKYKRLFAIFAFLTAGLFHEAFVFYGPCYAVVSIFKNKKDKTDYLPLLLPFFIYFFINFLDFTYHRPQNLIGNQGDHLITVPNLLAFIFSIPKNFLIVLGWLLDGFLIPQSLFWNATEKENIYLLSGILLLAISIFHYKKILHSKIKILLSITVFIFTLSLGLGIGRLGFSGLTYLNQCSYYHYFGVFFGIIVFASVIHNLKWGRFFIVLYALNSLWIGYTKVSSYGKQVEARDLEIAKKSLDILNHAKEGFCYAGSGNELVEKYLPEILFYRISCGLKPGIPFSIQ